MKNVFLDCKIPVKVLFYWNSRELWILKPLLKLNKLRLRNYVLSLTK